MKQTLTLIVLSGGISLATSSLFAQATGATSGTSPASTSPAPIVIRQAAAPVPAAASTSTISATTGTTVGTTPGGGTTPAVTPTGPAQPLGPVQPDTDGILREQAGIVNALRNIERDRNRGNQPNRNGNLQQVNPTPGLGSDRMRNLGVGNIQLTPANRPAGTTIRYIKKTVRRPIVKQTSPEGVGNSANEEEDDSEDQKEKDYQFDLRESLSDSTIMDLLSSDTSEVSPTEKLEKELAKERESEDIFKIGPDKSADGILVSFSGDTPAFIRSAGALVSGFSATPVYSDRQKQDDEELAEGDGKQADGSNPDGSYSDGTYGYNDTVVYFLDTGYGNSAKYKLKLHYVSRVGWNETVLKGKLDEFLKVDKEDLLANSPSEAQAKANIWNAELYKYDVNVDYHKTQINVYLVTDGDPLIRDNREKANKHLERTLGRSHRNWVDHEARMEVIRESDAQNLLNSGKKHTNSSVESGSDPEENNDERGQNLGNPAYQGGGNTEPGIWRDPEGSAGTDNTQQSTSGNEASAAADSSSSAGQSGSSGSTDTSNSTNPPESDSSNGTEEDGDEDEKDNENSEGEEDPNLIARGTLGGEERDQGKGPSWAVDSLYVGSKVANGGQTNGVGGTIRFGENGSEKPGQGPLNEKGITPSNSGFPTIRVDPERIDEGVVDLSRLESKLIDPTIRTGSDDGGDPNGTPDDGPIGTGTGGPVVDPNGVVTKDLENIAVESEFSNELDLDLENLDFSGSSRIIFD